MMAWALLFYYVAFYLVPWKGRQGYEWVWAEAPAHLPGPQWVAFALAMGLAYLVFFAVSALVGFFLRRDDKRWAGVMASIGGTGWLSPVDLVIPLFLVAAVVYAAARGFPLHGVLAAVLPAALPFGLSALKPSEKKNPEPPKGTGAEVAPELPQLAEIAYEPFIEVARAHAGSVTPRDTLAHGVPFEPPGLNVPGLADPNPFVVTWIVPRDEHGEALDAAPEEPFSGERPAALVRAVQEGARQRVVAFLAERVAGPEDSSLEDRINRLQTFVVAHLEDMPTTGRSRLPVACLAERHADPGEATILVAAMSLSLAIPVALWTQGPSFGLALEGLPSGSPVLSGREQFDARTKRRYVLLGTTGAATAILPLVAPYRRSGRERAQ